MVESDEVTEEGIEEAEDIETLRQALAEERERAEKYLANWQRSQADFANYKQRSEQERRESIEFANSALISNLLPIIDDLERALASVPAELDESGWTEGIRLIYNKLKATLEAQGLTEIQAKGEPFDPRLHEAVMQQEGEEGMVIEETQKGYRFREKVIRPSLVIVGKGEEEGKEGKQLRRRSRNGQSDRN
ncbi:MAG: nucleotide exchange factor GrpE [Dehalococcoidia bacterium]